MPSMASDVLVLTFTCKKCGTPFKVESPDLRVNVHQINCPACSWSPSQVVR